MAIGQDIASMLSDLGSYLSPSQADAAPVMGFIDNPDDASGANGNQALIQNAAPSASPASQGAAQAGAGDNSGGINDNNLEGMSAQLNALNAPSQSGAQGGAQPSGSGSQALITPQQASAAATGSGSDSDAANKIMNSINAMAGTSSPPASGAQAMPQNSSNPVYSANAAAYNKGAAQQAQMDKNAAQDTMAAMNHAAGMDTLSGMNSAISGGSLPSDPYSSSQGTDNAVNAIIPSRPSGNVWGNIASGNQNTAQQAQNYRNWAANQTAPALANLENSPAINPADSNSTQPAYLANTGIGGTQPYEPLFGNVPGEVENFAEWLDPQDFQSNGEAVKTQEEQAAQNAEQNNYSTGVSQRNMGDFAATLLNIPTAAVNLAEKKIGHGSADHRLAVSPYDPSQYTPAEQAEDAAHSRYNQAGNYARNTALTAMTLGLAGLPTLWGAISGAGKMGGMTPILNEAAENSRGDFSEAPNWSGWKLNAALGGLMGGGGKGFTPDPRNPNAGTAYEFTPPRAPAPKGTAPAAVSGSPVPTNIAANPNPPAGALPSLPADPLEQMAQRPLQQMQENPTDYAGVNNEITARYKSALSEAGQNGLQSQPSVQSAYNDLVNQGETFTDASENGPRQGLQGRIKTLQDNLGKQVKAANQDVQKQTNTFQSLTKMLNDLKAKDADPDLINSLQDQWETARDRLGDLQNTAADLRTKQSTYTDDLNQAAQFGRQQAYPYAQRVIYGNGGEGQLFNPFGQYSKESGALRGELGNEAVPRNAALPSNLPYQRGVWQGGMDIMRMTRDPDFIEESSSPNESLGMNGEGSSAENAGGAAASPSETAGMNGDAAGRNPGTGSPAFGEKAANGVEQPFNKEEANQFTANVAKKAGINDTKTGTGEKRTDEEMALQGKKFQDELNRIREGKAAPDFSQTAFPDLTDTERQALDDTMRTGKPVAGGRITPEMSAQLLDAIKGRRNIFGRAADAIDLNKQMGGGLTTGIAAALGGHPVTGAIVAAVPFIVKGLTDLMGGGRDIDMLSPEGWQKALKNKDVRAIFARNGIDVNDPAQRGIVQKTFEALKQKGGIVDSNDVGRAFAGASVLDRPAAGHPAGASVQPPVNSPVTPPAQTQETAPAAQPVDTSGGAVGDLIRSIFGGLSGAFAGATGSRGWMPMAESQAEEMSGRYNIPFGMALQLAMNPQQENEFTQTMARYGNSVSPQAAASISRYNDTVGRLNMFKTGVQRDNNIRKALGNSYTGLTGMSWADINKKYPSLARAFPQEITYIDPVTHQRITEPAYVAIQTLENDQPIRQQQAADIYGAMGDTDMAREMNTGFHPDAFTNPARYDRWTEDTLNDASQRVQGLYNTARGEVRMGVGGYMPRDLNTMPQGTFAQYNGGQQTDTGAGSSTAGQWTGY